MRALAVAMQYCELLRHPIQTRPDDVVGAHYHWSVDDLLNGVLNRRLRIRHFGPVPKCDNRPS